MPCYTEHECKSARPQLCRLPPFEEQNPGILKIYFCAKLARAPNNLFANHDIHTAKIDRRLRAYPARELRNGAPFSCLRMD